MSLQDLCTGPDTVVPAALRGYRTWRLGEGGELLSTAHDYQWRTGIDRAECRRLVSGAQSHATPAPATGCSCGFYGWYDPTDVRMVDAPIVGAVEVSGRVKLGSHGFRAERARVLGVVVPPALHHTTAGAHLVAQLEDDLVPVYESLEAMQAALPPDDVSDLVQHECDYACEREVLLHSVTSSITRSLLQARHFHFTAGGLVAPAPVPPRPPRWKRYGALITSAVLLALTAYSSLVLPVDILTRDDSWELDALRLALLPINVWGALWLWPRNLQRAWRWGR